MKVKNKTAYTQLRHNATLTDHESLLLGTLMYHDPRHITTNYGEQTVALRRCLYYVVLAALVIEDASLY